MNAGAGKACSEKKLSAFLWSCPGVLFLLYLPGQFLIFFSADGIGSA